MSKQSGYFEEAMALRMDNNEIVSQITDCLYHIMLDQFDRTKLTPIEGFNILYFAQLAIRTWLSAHPTFRLKESLFPVSCPPISGVNYPNAIPENKMIQTAVQFVRLDSIANGDPFDVSYATKIIGLAFDDNSELRVVRFTGNDTFDFDEWLSGFNSEST